MATFKSPHPEHLNNQFSIGSTLHVYCQVLIIFCRPTCNNRRLTPERTTVESGQPQTLSNSLPKPTRSCCRARYNRDSTALGVQPRVSPISACERPSYSVRIIGRRSLLPKICVSSPATLFWIGEQSPLLHTGRQIRP